MRIEPLFINFLNKNVCSNDIIKTVIQTAKDERTRRIAHEKEEVDLLLFRKDFENMILDMIDNGINQRVINFLNSYMKLSLEEYIDSGDGGRINESRYIGIKADDAPWLEAIICYNLCLYIKAYGFKEIKRCSVCNKFFSNKGKYAKYCSEMCIFSKRNV
jgi:hypothetical protein